MGNVHQSTDLTFRFKLKPEHKGVQQDKLPFQVINIIIKIFFFLNNTPMLALCDIFRERLGAQALTTIQHLIGMLYAGLYRVAQK